jgi:hypothetical protein
MRARPLVFYLVLVVIGVAAGFFVASRVMAGGTAPGSAADPLVSKSYVDEQVATYIAGLNQKISDLTAQEAQLEQSLAQVQGQQGISQSQPAQTSAPQQLYIKTGNSQINLRQGPGTNYALMGTATRGNPDSEPMTVLSQSGDWYQVRLPDDRTAWVADWLVEER